MQRFAWLYSVLLGLSWLPFSVLPQQLFSAVFKFQDSLSTPATDSRLSVDTYRLSVGVYRAIGAPWCAHDDGGKSDLLSYQLWQQAQKVVR